MRQHTEPVVAVTIPELVDQILARLDDNRSLKNCSLVCRTWSQLTPRYLFKTLRLNPTHHLLVPPTGGGIAPQPAFMWFVDKPRIKDNVRQVIVDSAKATVLSLATIQSLPYSPQLLADIHATFPHMISLHITTSCQFSAAEPASEDQTQSLNSLDYHVPSASRRIQKLDIFVSRDTFEHLPMQELVGVFAEIETLCLLLESSRFRHAHRLPPLDPLAPRRTKVKKLVLQKFDDDLMEQVCGIVTALDLTGLVSLSIIDHYPGVSVVHVNNFIREHVPHIRDFSVTCGPDVAHNYVSLASDCTCPSFPPTSSLISVISISQRRGKGILRLPYVSLQATEKRRHRDLRRE